MKTLNITLTISVISMLSLLQINAEGLSIDTAVEISWESTPATLQQVQYSTNLTSGVWFDLEEPFLGDGTTNHIFDSTRNSVTRSYKVIPIANSNIVGTFKTDNYPNADSGLWHFFPDNTFVSDFIETSQSLSIGTYVYSSNQLTLVFENSTNPNLIGEIEVHDNVIVSNNLYFTVADMAFNRGTLDNTNNSDLAGVWYGTFNGTGGTSDAGAESDGARFTFVSAGYSLTVGQFYYGFYEGEFEFSSGSVFGQGESPDNTRTMTYLGTTAEASILGIFSQSDGPRGTFEISKQ